MKETILKWTLVFMTIAVVSCDKTEIEDTSVTSETISLSRATEKGDDWIYFSLATGKEVIVNEEEHQANMSWDLAFNRYNIRTNGGKSGKGKGGAYDMGKVGYNSVKSLPSDAKLVIDTEYEISDNGVGFPPPVKKSTANPLLSVALEFSGPPPAYTPNEHIYIIKTAEGKFAKFICNSFYNAEGKSGYVTFEYTYQPDGTSIF